MDVLSPLFHMVLRSLVVLFPLTVGWLAFRRLALSKSANAWIYAVICLFAAVTAAGVLPWTLGLTAINWPLTVLALMCPAIWVGAILFCDITRVQRYGADPLLTLARPALREPDAQPGPLVLKPSDAAKPVFRHVARKEPHHAKPKTARSAKTQSILKLARDIRGHPTSDRHRRKLLPPPEKAELPFLRGSHHV